MKKVIIPVALIAAIGLIGPKLAGSSYNTQLDEFVTSVNDMPGYTATINERTQNWFTSSSVIEFGIDPAMFEDEALPAEQMEMFQDLTFKLNVNAQHGPVLLLNGFSLGLTAVKAETDLDTFRDSLQYAGDQSFYTIAGNVGFTSSFNGTDTIPSFTQAEGTIDGGSLEFSGWKGEFSVSSSNTIYDGAMDSFKFAAPDADTEVTISTITMESSLEGSFAAAMENVLYNSNAKFVMGELAVSSPLEEANMSMRNFVIDAVTKVNDAGTLMDMDLNYAMDELSVVGVDAKNVLLKTEFNNLEKTFFQAYQEASMDPELLPEVMETKLLPQLQANPEINIAELSGQINDGNFTGKIHTKLEGVDAMPALMTDTSFWMSKLVVDSKISMDKSMALWIGEQAVSAQMMSDPNTAGMTEEEISAIAAQQVEGMIGMFTQQGMITVTPEGMHEMTFTMKDGQAMLNGNPMPLPF